MDSGVSRERLQILGVRCEQQISIGGEQHDRRVNDIGCASATEQHSGTPPQRGVEWRDLERRQHAREVGLPP